MFEDARDFVFAIMPIIMRININIEFVDTRQQLQSSIPYKARQRGTTGYREDDHLNLHSETLSLFLHDRHYDLLYRKDHPSDLVWLFDRDKDLNNLIIDGLLDDEVAVSRTARAEVGCFGDPRVLRRDRDVSRVVNNDRRIARTDAKGWAARTIGRFDHRLAAGREGQITDFH